ncbi:MAG TPA: hypothetical protein VHO24_15310 [Opitutaceae bacterium]|nr:hypothetical protein [Opitutaceae bacterium]
MAPSPGATAAGSAPPPIHIRAPSAVSEASLAAEKPEHRPAFKWGITAALVILTVLLGVAGYVGWKFYKPAAAPAAATPKPNSTPAPVATTPTASPKAQALPPPEKTVPAPLPEPAETVSRISSSPTSAPEAKPTEPAGAPTLSTISSPVSTNLSPDVTAKTGMPMAVSNASPAFRSFIANAKITGVFQGRNPRAVINGKVTRIGETVDHALGIVFHDIDPSRKQVVFKDASGAIVTRKY